MVALVKHHRSYSVVNLLHHVGLGVSGPVSARLSHDAGDRHVVLDCVWVLQDHPGHAGAQMPSDVLKVEELADVFEEHWEGAKKDQPGSNEIALVFAKRCLTQNRVLTM